MIEIKDKSECCGCTACASACPVNCITMQEDDEGFLYPKVQLTNCINCDLCTSICPIISENKDLLSVTQALIVQDLRDEIRMKSSSGGAFSSIAEFVIEKYNGWVYGAAFGLDFSVVHKGVNSVAELSEFRGSKYTQSNLSEIFREVKQHLDCGEYVCFSGTPCQVGGLQKYLRKRYDNCILVDVACHGVPSPSLFKRYRIFWENKEKSALNEIEFRSKKYGYSGSTMRLQFENGKEVTQGRMLQFFKNTMFSGLSLRPSCHECRFKTVERVSDFTIFDCWDVNNFQREFDDDKGTTAVLVRTLNARRIIDSMKGKWRSKEVDATVLIANDGDMITESALASKNRTQFFDDMKSLEIIQLNNKYFPISLRGIVVLLFKPILSRLNILKWLKRK